MRRILCAASLKGVRNDGGRYGDRLTSSNGLTNDTDQREILSWASGPVGPRAMPRLVVLCLAAVDIRIVLSACGRHTATQVTAWCAEPTRFVTSTHGTPAAPIILRFWTMGPSHAVVSDSVVRKRPIWGRERHV